MNYMIGIEREGLRIFPDGRLADTLHPAEFGDRLKEPLIGTDFGEAMLELRTSPRPDPESCYRELRRVTGEALKVLYERGELLWPYSLPFKTPDEMSFSGYYNRYPERPDLEAHERLLTKVYGIKRNCISGIHVNLSVSDETLAEMRYRYPSVPSEKDEAYLKCARQILAHEREIGYFLDASPTDLDGRLISKDSLRNSPMGFWNPKADKLDYSSKAAYLDSLQKVRSYERRTAIRLKCRDGENVDEGIRALGIDRIEFRLCDIDPYDVCGISLKEMELVSAIFFVCMVADEIPEGPDGLLRKCFEVNSELSLGFDSALQSYREQEEQGIRKCDAVRRLIREEGYEGILQLAEKYSRCEAGS